MASAKIIELDETNTCKICDNALAKYSCPKCNILYCSLTCYQSACHLECTESFYKENVMAELNSELANGESKTKMMEILERFHENNKIPDSTTDFLQDNDLEDFDEANSDLDLDDIGSFSQFVDVEDLEEDLDSDDDEYIDIAERLAGVNIDDTDKVWERLTEDEKEDFVAFLKTEEVAKLIPAWKPWWYYSSKVTELDADGVEDFKKECPKLGDIKDFNKLTTKSPANCVKYNLINILSGYAFMARYFNGEHGDFEHEAVACIANVSLALKKGVNFEDYDTAVKSVEQECINVDWIITGSENLDLMREDLTKILQGPNEQEKNYYVLCALTDLQNLLKSCQFKPRQSKLYETKSSFYAQFSNGVFPHMQYETKEKIKKYIKKTEYFLSFAKDIL